MSISQTTTVEDILYEVGTEAVFSSAFSEYDITPECHYVFSYGAALQDDSPLPGFISFDSETRIFSVQTDDAENAGEYVVKIIATLNDE